MPAEYSVDAKFKRILEDLAPVRHMYPNIVRNLEEIQHDFHQLFVHYDQTCKQLCETEEAWARTIIESVETS